MAEQNRRNQKNEKLHVKCSLRESRNARTVAKRSADSCLRGRILGNKKNGTGPR